MAQPKDFLYFLTDQLGRSYRVNNGIVDAVSTPTPLPVTPDGWQEKSIKYGRNMRYFGLFRSFTTPLKFVRDAAHITRDRFYRRGTEDKLNLVICWLDKTFTGGWIHRFFYKGELDLSKAEDSETDMNVNIMEGSLSKLFKANEGTTYELDMESSVTVGMDGLLLHEKHSFSVQSGPVAPDHLVGVLFVTKEGAATGVETFTIYNQNEPGDLTTSQEFFLSTSQVVDGARLAGSVKLTPLLISGTYNLRLKSNLGRNEIVAAQSYSAGNEITVNFDYSFNSLTGENFFLVGDLPSAVAIYAESDITLQFSSRYKTTFIPAIRPAIVAQKLLDKITGGGYTFKSEYLTQVWENLLITSGDGIRGIQSPKLKTSWTDFFDSYNVPCNLSLAIRNNEVIVERKAEAFKSTILQDLGQVRDLRKKTFQEAQFNVVKIGYPNTDTEDVNGRDEFNVTHVYTSEVSKVNKTLELISKYIASMYEAELTRINLDGKTTTDNNNDNRVFFLHAEKTPILHESGIFNYYKLFRDTYDSITGLISPESAFNIELSPKRCLFRHGNYLRSVFYWLETGKLKFETSDKNAELKTVKAGVTIEEKADVIIGALDAPLFVPLTFEFEGPVPRDIIQTMEVGPDGTFIVRDGDDILYGFPMEIGIQPANNPAMETTLLCSPQTDLTQFIR